MAVAAAAANAALTIHSQRCRPWPKPTAIGHNRPVERRRNLHHGQSPMTTLKQLPALVVLERIPVPALAMGRDGSILFTNTAFADMVGCEPDEVLSLRFDQIFHQAPASESLLSVVHALANMVVELAHKDGSVVRALMRDRQSRGPTTNLPSRRSRI